MYFPLAVSNLFAGLYIEQVCLACLFFLNVKDDKVPSIIQGCLAVLLIILTLGAQIMFNKAFERMFKFLIFRHGRALMLEIK